jgi:hypothetical protein
MRDVEGEENIVKRLCVCLAVLALCPFPARAQSVDIGASVVDGKLARFSFAVSSHYGVPEPEVVRFRQRYRLPDEDLPVLFFLAARARVAPSAVMELRAGGLSWLDITFHYGLTPEVFYVPVTAKQVGPPYGNAYGYYRKYRAGREWRKIALSDREVVDLVNLRFLSEYHGVPPETVMGMRGRGLAFTAIHDDMGKGKGGARGKDQGKGRPGKAGKGKTRKSP